MERIEAQTFEAHVGSQFEVTDAPQQFSITLTKLVVHEKSPSIETFSLFFRGPLSSVLAQGTRRLSHPELGELEIFLVPVSKFVDGYEYEAVFNHIL